MPLPLNANTRDMLRLTLTPGVGPILARRLLSHFGALERMLRATPNDLRSVEGIGEKLSHKIAAGLRESERLAEIEIERCERTGVRLIASGDPAYPPLLAETRDAPPVLYVRGDPAALTRGYTVGVVGSRHCTAYGIEQAERFSAFLASSGLVIVSGGARGIDSAAHRAALRGKGTTVAVVGCGLSHCYPPENAELFQQMCEAGGAVVSELPMDTSPTADNFPARNRIISALSLGVLVIEAPRGSGALITARCAIDEHGREVMAVPGRIDSPASEGSNELIKKGEAALVAAPGDVLELLESPARHQWRGTHDARYEAGEPTGVSRAHLQEDALFGREQENAGTGDKGGTRAGADGGARGARPETSGVMAATAPGADRSHAGPMKVPPVKSAVALTERQRMILAALSGPMSFEELSRATSLDAGAIQAELTVLELRRVVKRDGGRFARRAD
jgi:DNA processing protein